MRERIHDNFRCPRVHPGCLNYSGAPAGRRSCKGAAVSSSGKLGKVQSESPISPNTLSPSFMAFCSLDGDILLILSNQEAASSKRP